MSDIFELAANGAFIGLGIFLGWVLFSPSEPKRSELRLIPSSEVVQRLKNEKTEKKGNNQ